VETYTFLRHMADSWFLLGMFVFFIGAILFLWRPGSRKVHDDAAGIVFRHDDRPAPDAGAANTQANHLSKEVRS
jgi:cytochrome c oxidase cbb3-type subunit IV